MDVMGSRPPADSAFLGRGALTLHMAGHREESQGHTAKWPCLSVHTHRSVFSTSPRSPSVYPQPGLRWISDNSTTPPGCPRGISN